MSLASDATTALIDLVPAVEMALVGAGQRTTEPVALLPSRPRPRAA